MSSQKQENQRLAELVQKLKDLKPESQELQSIEAESDEAKKEREEGRQPPNPRDFILALRHATTCMEPDVVEDGIGK